MSCDLMAFYFVKMIETITFTIPMFDTIAYTQRQKATFTFEDLAAFKKQAIAWANQQAVLVYLDSNQYPPSKYSQYEALIGVGATAQLTKWTTGGAFEQLKNFHQTQKDWLFGFLGYDLKNDVERLQSANEDPLGFPEMHFFVPETPKTCFVAILCLVFVVV